MSVSHKLGIQVISPTLILLLATIKIVSHRKNAEQNNVVLATIAVKVKAALVADAVNRSVNQLAQRGR